MTKRASIALSTLMVFGLGSACGSLLQGSRCNDDGSCGGGLVCDPATRTCVESLPTDASVTTTDAGEEADAGVEADASVPDAGAPDAGEEADAGETLDAGEPDAGEPDAGLLSPPTRECEGDVWCRAQLPARDGGWPQLTSVSGLDDTKIWVGGKGPTMLLWDGDAWSDRSAKLAADSADAGYPITDVNALSTNGSFVFWGGAANGSTSATSCGWTYSDGSDDFRYQSYCSGRSGVSWLGAHVDMVSTNSAFAVGTGGTFYAYGYTDFGTFDDPVATDFRAVHWRSSGQVWIVGAAGEVRYKPLDDSNTKDARSRGFPTISNELYAVRVVDGSLFVAGDEALYECDRVGTDAFPTLADCTNALGADSGLKIRGLVGDSREEMWAVGIDASSNPPGALLLVRAGRNQWTREDLPQELSAVPLHAIWRYHGLMVVVGDNGAVFSKLGAP